MSQATLSANRPDFDQVIQQITDYVLDYDATQSPLAMETAHYCLMDSIACALMALKYPACVKLLGPSVPGATLPNTGAKVPGTSYQLEPIQASFNFGAMVRWLDFNDTWLAAEWGHPSDNLGSILMVADYLNRSQQSQLTLSDILQAMIKAHEIQGVLALKNSFNRVGLDHVMLVRIASTAVIANMLGLNREQILNAVSHAWLDGSSLRTYRHAPNTGSRKSWAAGDATSRAVRLALIAQTGEMGYPSAITASVWGFQDVSFDGKPLLLEQEFNQYVMENILFKISFPAEFHAQTAVEAAITLHPQVKDRLEEIKEIVIETQESGDRIINKTGKLDNPADRDHCIQYMTAIGLIKGDLVAADYEDEVANMPMVDHIRDKMVVKENALYSKEYLDSDKRSIANAVQVFFNDGSKTEKIEVHYPIGHRSRRDEGIPVLVHKFEQALQESDLSADTVETITQLFAHKSTALNIHVNELMDLLWLG